MGAQPFVAAILQERNPVGALEAGFVIGGIGIGGLLYTLSVGFLVRRLGPRRMVVMGGVAAGGALFAFGLGAPWQADVLAFVVLGFGFMMLHNTLQTLATELAPDARGSAIALFAFSFFIGQGFGPLGFGALYYALGTAAALTLSRSPSCFSASPRARCSSIRADSDLGQPRARYGGTPWSGSQRSSGGFPVCQNTSMGMPPRGNQ